MQGVGSRGKGEGRRQKAEGRRKRVEGSVKKEELTNRNGENINCPSLSQEVIRDSIQETYTRIKCF